jgi:hypothetical protein
MTATATFFNGFATQKNFKTIETSEFRVAFVLR